MSIFDALNSVVSSVSSAASSAAAAAQSAVNSAVSAVTSVVSQVSQNVSSAVNSAVSTATQVVQAVAPSVISAVSTLVSPISPVVQNVVNNVVNTVTAAIAPTQSTIVQTAGVGVGNQIAVAPSTYANTIESDREGWTQTRVGVPETVPEIVRGIIQFPSTVLSAAGGGIGNAQSWVGAFLFDPQAAIQNLTLLNAGGILSYFTEFWNTIQTVRITVDTVLYRLMQPLGNFLGQIYTWLSTAVGKALQGIWDNISNLAKNITQSFADIILWMRDTVDAIQSGMAALLDAKLAPIQAALDALNIDKLLKLADILTPEGFGNLLLSALDHMVVS